MRRVATLYGYSVPGAVSPHRAAATDVVTLLGKLGELLDLTPSILASLDIPRGRTWTISS